MQNLKLVEAAISGTIGDIRSAIAEGYNIELAYNGVNRVSALEYACEYLNIPVANYLLDLGANPIGNNDLYSQPRFWTLLGFGARLCDEEREAIIQTAEAQHLRQRLINMAGVQYCTKCGFIRFEGQAHCDCITF